MEPIQTTSGKTARAHLAELRQRRMDAKRDQEEILLEKLDGLANQCYSVVRLARSEINALRMLAIEAKQIVAAVRKVRKKLDVEL